MRDFEWMRDARCLGMVDPMWDESTPSVEALRVCFRCPVRSECLAYGLSRPDASDAGVMGGTGYYDREQVRAGRRTVGEVVAFRLGRLVEADRAEAETEHFVWSMPRLALA
jgi:hypothetical protein